MGKKKGGEKAAPAEPEVMVIENDGPPASGPYVEFSLVTVSGGLKRGDKGTKNAKNDLYLKFTFAEEGVLYSCKTECLDNADPNVYSHYPGKYALAIPETLNFPFSIKVTAFDQDMKSSDDELGHAAVKILDVQGTLAEASFNAQQGTFNLTYEVFNLEKEFVYEYVHVDAPGPRPIMPITSTSAEAVYLEEKVWPTLEPALERLLGAVRYHIDKADIAKLKGGPDDAQLHRVTRPELAKEFDPLAWLATYLDWYNPNVAPQFTEESAAIYIQCAYRKMRAKQELARLRKAYQERTAASDHRKLRNKSATIIQAVYRGHCVRMSFMLGRSADFSLTRQVKA